MIANSANVRDDLIDIANGEGPMEVDYQWFVRSLLYALSEEECRSIMKKQPDFDGWIAINGWLDDDYRSELDEE